MIYMRGIWGLIVGFGKPVIPMFYKLIIMRNYEVSDLESMMI
jgi:hypothetical protein